MPNLYSYEGGLSVQMYRSIKDLGTLTYLSNLIRPSEIQFVNLASQPSPHAVWALIRFVLHWEWAQAAVGLLGWINHNHAWEMLPLGARGRTSGIERLEVQIFKYLQYIFAYTQFLPQRTRLQSNVLMIIKKIKEMRTVFSLNREDAGFTCVYIHLYSSFKS